MEEFKAAALLPKIYQQHPSLDIIEVISDCWEHIYTLANPVYGDEGILYLQSEGFNDVEGVALGAFVDVVEDDGGDAHETGQVRAAAKYLLEVVARPLCTYFAHHRQEEVHNLAAACLNVQAFRTVPFDYLGQDNSISLLKLQQILSKDLAAEGTEVRLVGFSGVRRLLSPFQGLDPETILDDSFGDSAFSRDGVGSFFRFGLFLISLPGRGEDLDLTHFDSV